MPRRISVEPHLSEQELFKRYKSLDSNTERDRYHILWLVSRGKTSEEVADVTGANVRGVRTLVRRYNKGGPDAMIDRRRHNGSKKRLTDEQIKELEEALGEDPPEGGLWNSVKVAAWIEHKTGVRTLPQLGWDYLKRLEYALRVPRRRHKKGDPAKADDFKKKSCLRPLSTFPESAPSPR